MAVDLTFYNKKHQQDVEFASKKVQEWITAYTERECCINCEAHIIFNVPVRTVKVKYEAIHHLMGSIFFSSGFWSKFEMTKKTTEYEVNLWLKAMTPEEKEKALFSPDLD